MFMYCYLVVKVDGEVVTVLSVGNRSSL